MSKVCATLHNRLSKLPRHRFPFDDVTIPKNGIYILFEKGETAHGTDRIVRVGTHTGEGQLASRLRQHFVNENKDRSIFRKNIGRALLCQKNDPYLAIWEIDFTTREAREKSGHLRNMTKEARLEKHISSYLQENMSFAIIEAPDRLGTEAKIIASTAQCQDCKPSPSWLGQYSPKEKIRSSGLWLVNELAGVPFTEPELTIILNQV